MPNILRGPKPLNPIYATVAYFQSWDTIPARVVNVWSIIAAEHNVSIHAASIIVRRQRCR